MTVLMTGRDRKGMIGFIGSEFLLYLIFMTGDISGHPSSDTVTLVKYLSILLCNLFAFICAFWLRQKENYILFSGLFFTGISDYFLLFTNNFTFGMFTFCVVQTLYLVYLYLLGDRRRGIPSRLIMNIILWAITLFVLFTVHIPVNLLLIIVVFYFISILHNVITAAINARCKPNRRNLIFAAGMFLFLLCDINVGIYNMNGFINIESAGFTKIYQFSEVAMWMFYLPAQVCIALSGMLKEDTNYGAR